MSKLIVVFIFILVACNSRKETEQEQNLLTSELSRPSKVSKVRTVSASVGDLQSTSINDMQANLYGKFFYDRAEYYIINNPTNKLKGKDIVKATLYYFDGQLYKIKYITEHDLSYELINEKKQFKVRALDSLSRSIVKQQPVVFRVNNELQLNDNLSRYELTWEKDNKLVKWKTSDEGNGNLFEYSEVLADYKKKYKELEIFESKY